MSDIIYSQTLDDIPEIFLKYTISNSNTKDTDYNDILFFTLVILYFYDIKI